MAGTSGITIPLKSCFVSCCLSYHCCMLALLFHRSKAAFSWMYEHVRACRLCLGTSNCLKLREGEAISRGVIGRVEQSWKARRNPVRRSASPDIHVAITLYKYLPMNVAIHIHRTTKRNLKLKTGIWKKGCYWEPVLQVKKLLKYIWLGPREMFLWITACVALAEDPVWFSARCVPHSCL